MMIIWLHIYFAILALAQRASADIANSMYIVSNAEDLSLDRVGLTVVGEERAITCLPSLFGQGSPFNIGYLVTCTPNPTINGCISAYQTIQPLAQNLGLTVNSSCPTSSDPAYGSNQGDCVKNLVNDISNNDDKAIMIVWNLEDIDDLADDLDLNNAPDFPRDHYDVAWIIRQNNFVSQISEACPGIDVPTVST